MLAHSADYLAMLSIVCVAWQWLRMWTVAPSGSSFGEGVVACASYWLRTELPRATTLAELCESGERSYVDLRADAL